LQGAGDRNFDAVERQREITFDCSRSIVAPDFSLENSAQSTQLQR